jgi:hypothetical protein
MSIQITNFSVAEGEWGYASSGVSVDLTDLTNIVTTSGCYLEVGGTTVSATLTSISGGYRMEYDPVDDFTSLEGPTTFRAHASNNIGQNVYQDFYLTYGYLVEYNNRSQDGWNFGYQTEVVVRASAENSVSCPVSNAEAFWFETEDRPQKHLGATIVGVPAKYTSDSDDMSASIYPQSTAFFYGETYTVVLRAKDFAGNEMEYEFEFKIEDKP